MFGVSNQASRTASTKAAMTMRRRIVAVLYRPQRSHSRSSTGCAAPSGRTSGSDLAWKWCQRNAAAPVAGGSDTRLGIGAGERPAQGDRPGQHADGVPELPGSGQAVEFRGELFPVADLVIQGQAAHAQPDERAG